jgi:hypothetical protein
MKLTELFTDFEAWVKHAVERGFTGPTQVQGHQMFEFTHEGEKVAHWDGAAGTGTVVKAQEPVTPTPEPTPEPEPPAEPTPPPKEQT